MNKSPITTHILNTSLGKPAANVQTQLFVLNGKEWQLLSSAVTNDDGRINHWESNTWYKNKDPQQLFATYKIVFELDDYWLQQNTPAFYPSAEICFRIQDSKHHHIPLLLAAYGYSTYRGS
ncbi:MAG: 5-hydroxyisourate hydrolase [Psychromonas sp.]|jgi:5-hydroxyisourate hydrolase|uniref:hydroxyisourate hydrolase n=1 Tax=Psychromonas sp. TaxID=1884585 RepID=UPI0039E45B8C